MKKILFSLLMLCSMMTAWAEDDGYVNVATAAELKEVISANDHANVRLTADIYMSDLGEGESGRHTLCSTFYGTLDGDGNTIWAARPEVQHDGGGHYHRQYLFTYCNGAIIKNLTFKDFRVQSEDNANQAIITSQAKNKCVFDNITLDNVSVFCNNDNSGGVTGYTEDCTFRNITVKNSDFTTDETQSGAVVGHAKNNCTFTNIKVENCESTSDDGKSGGVAGRTDDCTIENVEILGTFVKTNSTLAAGVVGYSVNTEFSNCIVDDQSCVCADGSFHKAEAAGITGEAVKCNIYNCINSALIAADDYDAGGIVGYMEDTNIVGCLNTGMVISIDMDDVKSDFYNKYKTRTGMTCVTKTYQGKEYVIRKYDGVPGQDNHFGGIVGRIYSGSASKCVNFGSVYCGKNQEGSGLTSYTTGGIAGSFRAGTISDCLCDFSGGMDTNGICSFDGEKASVDNCLNMTTYKDISADEWKSFSGGNNYSLTTADDAHHVTKTTAAKIKSGEICAKLGENWEQQVGIDTYPAPTGGGKGVYHTREVSNEYGTVCLPFALESNEDITYYTFYPDVKIESGKVILEFRKADVVEAGYPVLYRTSKTGEITFSNAGDSFSDMPQQIASTESHWGIVGVYEQKVFTESTSPSSDHVYYVSDGKIRNAKKVTIAPYRAWLGGEPIYDLQAAGVKSFQIALDDENGSTTALELVGDDFVPMKNNGKIFSLMGTEVGDSYRGIVIKNGKKMIQNR